MLSGIILSPGRSRTPKNRTRGPSRSFFLLLVQSRGSVGGQAILSGKAELLRSTVRARNSDESHYEVSELVKQIHP